VLKRLKKTVKKRLKSAVNGHHSVQHAVEQFLFIERLHAARHPMPDYLLRLWDLALTRHLQ